MDPPLFRSSGQNKRTTSGFGGCPSTKFLSGIFGSLHLLSLVPMNAKIFNQLKCQIPSQFRLSEVSRFSLSRFVFLDSKDAVFCLILFYQFRIFERRFGTRKFCTHLITSQILTLILEITITVLISNGSELLSPTLITTGPFGMIIPWFVYFYHDIPQSLSQPAAIAISGKFLCYILGLQVAALSQENLVAFISAIISGYLVRWNFLWIQNWIQIPKSIGSLCDRLIGWMVASDSDSDGLLGATLEIQRTEQMEQMEQILIRQQQQAMNGGRRVGQGYAEQLVNPMGGFYGGGGHQGQQRHRRVSAAPSEMNIRTLMDMGFSRERVETALRQSGDDVQSATAILLQGFQQ